MKDREIKFRLRWDNHAPTFETLMAITHGFVQMGYVPNVFGRLVGTDQYTGIKDKNNNDIYEGDKVKVYLSGWGKERDEYTGVVVYKEGAFFIDKLYDTQYKEPKCQYFPHNSMLLSCAELYEPMSKDYIPNYGEVFTFSENLMYVEIIP